MIALLITIQVSECSGGRLEQEVYRLFGLYADHITSVDGQIARVGC